MTNSPIPDLQQELAAVAQIGQVASSPFIKNPASQAKVQTIAAEVNLGIAALPLFAQLFQTIGSLLHHAHAAMQPATPPPAPPVAADPTAIK